MTVDHQGPACLDMILQVLLSIRKSLRDQAEGFMTLHKSPQHHHCVVLLLMLW